MIGVVALIMGVGFYDWEPLNIEEIVFQRYAFLHIIIEAS